MLSWFSFLLIRLPCPPMAETAPDPVLNGIVVGDDVVFGEEDSPREDEDIPPDLESDPSESPSVSTHGLSASPSGSGSKATTFSFILGVVSAVFCRLLPKISCPCWSRIPDSSLTVIPEPSNLEMDEGMVLSTSILGVSEFLCRDCYAYRMSSKNNEPHRPQHVIDKDFKKKEVEFEGCY